MNDNNTNIQSLPYTDSIISVLKIKNGFSEDNNFNIDIPQYEDIKFKVLMYSSDYGSIFGEV